MWPVAVLVYFKISGVSTFQGVDLIFCNLTDSVYINVLIFKCLTVDQPLQGDFNHIHYIAVQCLPFSRVHTHACMLELKRLAQMWLTV